MVQLLPLPLCASSYSARIRWYLVFGIILYNIYELRLLPLPTKSRIQSRKRHSGGAKWNTKKFTRKKMSVNNFDYELCLMIQCWKKQNMPKCVCGGSGREGGGGLHFFPSPQDWRSVLAGYFTTFGYSEFRFIKQSWISETFVILRKQNMDEVLFAAMRIFNCTWHNPKLLGSWRN